MTTGDRIRQARTAKGMTQQELADRLGVMNKGEVLFCGTKSEFYSVTGETSVENAFIKMVGGERE